MDTPWLQSLFEVLDQHMKRGACTRIKCYTDQTKRGMKLSIVKLSFVYCFIVLRLMCCFGNSALKRPIVNSLINLATIIE
jgi:hypothetical protein